MDRTIIGPWKAEEKELSDKLHKKLQGLILLHPPTDEFRKCINEEMFLKPNQTAFFQVMHYLFKLLDPVEFRKRFYWPITDKRGEANFRSSTIEYLKHLDEKHHLNWTHIKSYLVVMPGGMKFINFMLDLVGFVVQEQIKLREKQLSNDAEIAGQVSDLNMKRMRKQNAFFKEYASDYMAEADVQIAKLKEKTQLIRQSMRHIKQQTTLEVEQLLDDEFVVQFEASNRYLYEQKFCQPSANISQLEQPLANLKEVIDKFQNKEAELKIDNDAVRRSLIKMQNIFPEHKFIADEEFHAMPYEDSVKMDSLLEAFNCMHGMLEEQLNTANQMPLSSAFVTQELDTLKTELQQIETQITDFQKKLNAETKKKTQEQRLQHRTPMRNMAVGVDGLTNKNIQNTLRMKFVATPPIKLEMQEGSRNANTRLPLLDDFTLNAERSMVAGAKAGIETLNNLLAIPRSARKLKNNADISIDLNSTANRSKIMDPMQLLRTINKDTSKAVGQPQHNLSALGSKWKERQCLFGNDIEATPGQKRTNTSVEKSLNRTSEHGQQRTANSTMVSSPFTPFNSNSNERTRIARSQLLDSSGGGSLLYTKKLSAVKKVQDASLNLHNLSTSPSGRLDPLVTLEAKDVPKLLLNDLSLTENLSLHESFTGIKPLNTRNTSFKLPSAVQTNNENDANRSNIDIKFTFNMSPQPDDAELFNISDSVLKDVTM